MLLENVSLAQVVDTMAEGVFVVDASRCIVLWNKAMELLTGYSASETFGKECSFLQCEGLLESADGPGNCPLHGQGLVGAGRRECLLRDCNGEQIPVLNWLFTRTKKL